MYKKSALVFFLFVLGLPIDSFAQENFFWSEANLGEGASPGELELTVQQGSTTDLFLYYDDQGQSVLGWTLDFSWTEPGVVRFTHAESFNYDITVGIGGPAFDTRHDVVGEAGVINDNSIENLVAINGAGVVPGNDGSGLFFDTGYDFDSESFQVGIISFEAIGIGTTIFQVDDALVAGGGGEALDPPFRQLTIHVVPEPNSMFLIGTMFLSLTLRRKRN